MHQSAALPDRLQTVDVGSFQTLVTEGRGPMVVEFMSYGCAHCRVMEPAIQRVAEHLGRTEQFFRVNVGAERELADAFTIRATPTFVMLRDGREIARVEGPPPNAAHLSELLSEPFIR